MEHQQTLILLSICVHATILLATHDEAVAARADRIIKIEDGKLAG